MIIEWPEKFVYVCSAGRASLVNALPLVYSGLDRVHSVVILCGASGPETTDPTERQNAVDPARRLETFLNRRSGGRISSRMGTCTVVFGDPEDIGFWRAKMAEVSRSASGSATLLPVVFNVKGGMKEMAIGGLINLITARFDDAMLVTVPGDPARVQCIDNDAQIPLPACGPHLSLSEYLGLYGFREHQDPDPALRREEFEKMCVNHARGIKAFAAAFLPYAPTAWPALRTMAACLEPDRRNDHAFSARSHNGVGETITVPRRRADKPEREIVARALACLAGIPLRANNSETSTPREFRP